MRQTHALALIATIVPAISVSLSLGVMRLHPFGHANDFAQGVVVGLGIGAALVAIGYGAKRLGRLGRMDG